MVVRVCICLWQCTGVHKYASSACNIYLDILYLSCHAWVCVCAQVYICVRCKIITVTRTLERPSVILCSCASVCVGDIHAIARIKKQLDTSEYTALCVLT